MSATPSEAVLALDIDGVLNHRPHYATLLGTPTPPAGWLAPDCVARLNQITDRTGCHVVVSSSWPLHLPDGVTIEQVLREGGVTGRVVGHCATSVADGELPEDAHRRAMLADGWRLTESGWRRP